MMNLNEIEIDVEAKKLTPNWYAIQLHKRNVSDYLGWLLNVNKVSQQEHDSLQSMIKSQDNENFVLAIEIMQTKKSNQNGNNIHSGNAQV